VKLPDAAGDEGVGAACDVIDTEAFVCVDTHTHQHTHDASLINLSVITSE